MPKKIHCLVKGFSSLVLLVCSLSLNTVYGQIRYVKPVATGTGDGSSWANASANLQAMIQASPSGGQVWVKSGTYTPTTKPYNGSSPISTADARDVTFHIKNDVSLYGGFAGTETNVNQRNIQLNQTILSGDIGAAGDSTDNAYHVVMMAATSFTVGYGILDGFTVKGGNANGTGTVAILIYAAKRNFGGGVYTSMVNGTIRNCVFEECATSAGGSAVYTYRTTMVMDYCQISDNHSQDKGGGVYSDHVNPPYATTINHTDFSNNSSVTDGAGYFATYGTVTIKNTMFEENHSSTNGGGAYISAVTLLIDSCEFSTNTTSSGCGGLYV